MSETRAKGGKGEGGKEFAIRHSLAKNKRKKEMKKNIWRSSAAGMGTTKRERLEGPA